MLDAICGGLEPQAGNMGKYLGLGKRKYHELMIRDFIFKGNTPKTVTFDVGEYMCSFVGGMGS
jgi:hypothetical protein